MNILEKDIEDLLFEQLELKNYKLLHESGLPIYSGLNWYRQLRLGSYGIADIVGYDYINNKTYSDKGELTITIIELKKNEINLSGLTQSLRYKKGIKSLILSSINTNNTIVRFQIYLIGKTLNTKDEIYVLSEVCGSSDDTYFEYLTYSLDFNFGLRFKTIYPSQYDLVEKGEFKDIEILLSDFKKSYKNEK